MPFPDTPRVVYEKNTLEEVICQLRFPPILKIDASPPAGFQDAIRQMYPLFTEVRGGSVELPADLRNKLPKQFTELLAINQQNRAYNFATTDEQWKVSLTRDYIALISNAYNHWTDFSKNFEQPLMALHAEYEPTFFSRVGLRYRNIIRRSRLGLSGVPWSELLQPHIAGALATSELNNGKLRGIHQQIEVELDGGIGQVNIRHGLVTDTETEELCYTIDNDFFTTENLKESKDVEERLDEFNERASRLFRWCICDTLHDAMGPT